jgi:hypothetical protein
MRFHHPTVLVFFGISLACGCSSSPTGSGTSALYVDETVDLEPAPTMDPLTAAKACGGYDAVFGEKQALIDGKEIVDVGDGYQAVKTDTGIVSFCAYNDSTTCTECQCAAAGTPTADPIPITTTDPWSVDMYATKKYTANPNVPPAKGCACGNKWAYGAFTYGADNPQIPHPADSCVNHFSWSPSWADTNTNLGKIKCSDAATYKGPFPKATSEAQCEDCKLQFLYDYFQTQSQRNCDDLLKNIGDGICLNTPHAEACTKKPSSTYITSELPAIEELCKLAGEPLPANWTAAIKPGDVVACAANLKPADKAAFCKKNFLDVAAKNFSDRYGKPRPALACN